MKSIVVLLPWFGKWPAWIDLFLESCRWNPTIDFVLITDAPDLSNAPTNVKFISTTFEDYVKKIQEETGLDIKWRDPYKLCEIRPAFGVVHHDIISDYDYWGYGDIDVIYGNIRAFYDDTVLSHDLISTHPHVTCGHFILLKNTPHMNNAFRKVLHWKWLMGTKERKSFDERIFSLLFVDEGRRKERGVHRFLAAKNVGSALLEERFSTGIKGFKWIDGTDEFPTEWYWKQGRLTTNKSKDREFLYLHFTNWASARWGKGAKAVWSSVDRLVRVEAPYTDGFMISAAGFEPIPADRSEMTR